MSLKCIRTRRAVERIVCHAREHETRRFPAERPTTIEGEQGAVASGGLRGSVRQDRANMAPTQMGAQSDTV
jgi:hypothetical protein